MNFDAIGMDVYYETLRYFMFSYINTHISQIMNVFEQVRGSFQYLINSWTTFVELMSIYKRLKAFEAAIDGEATSTLLQQSIQALEGVQIQPHLYLFS